MSKDIVLLIYTVHSKDVTQFWHQ